MRQNHGVRDHTGDALALLVDHHCRHTHHETSISELRVHTLNRMARHTRQPISVERAVALSVRVKCAREYADGVVAAIAMPRELNAPGLDQNVDAGAIERRSKRIGVQGLTPLVVRLLMAMPTVGCVRKGPWFDKGVSFDRCISRKRNPAGS